MSGSTNYTETQFHTLNQAVDPKKRLDFIPPPFPSRKMRVSQREITEMQLSRIFPSCFSLFVTDSRIYISTKRNAHTSLPRSQTMPNWNTAAKEAKNLKKNVTRVRGARVFCSALWVHFIISFGRGSSTYFFAFFPFSAVIGDLVAFKNYRRFFETF